MTKPLAQLHCRTCGSELPMPRLKGVGRFTCEGCLPKVVRTRAHQPRACVRCQKTKEPEAFPWGDQTRTSNLPNKVKRRKGICRRRSSVCQECWSADEQERELRRLAREVTAATWTDARGRRVRRCGSCHKVKRLRSDFYITGKRKSGKPVHHYYCKVCNGERTAAYHRRRMSVPETAEDERRRRRKAQDRWRKKNREAYLRARKSYLARLKADPERYAQHLENRRIAYRLRQERTGRTVTATPRAQMSNGHKTKPPRLPAQPLADRLERFVKKEQAERLVGDGISREDILAPLGISARALYRWQNQTHASVKFEVADAILTATGLMWHDIWTPEEFPEVVAALAP